MGNPRQVWLVVIAVVLIAAAVFVVVRTTQGDKKEAEQRAQAFSTPQGVAKIYQSNEHMPPQARAAAEAAARAHGAPMAATGQSGR